MLWQKAWIESRGRFLLGVAATLTACAYSWYANRLANQGVPRTTFIVFCFLLGMGGLLREHAVGTAPFTLALPVSRLRLVGTRAAVGWIELVALALLASLFTASPLSSWLLWVAGGSSLFAFAFLASSVLAGEYTPFVVAWIAFFAHTTTTQYVRLMRPALRPYLFTLQEIMSRLRPFPTPLAVAVLAGVSCALLATAALVTRRCDY
jgi:hypothetical protein